jgi:hypothetical protein
MSRVKPRVAIAVLLILVVGWLAWRSQLWTVARPGEAPRPLVLIAGVTRTPVALAVTLPAVPVGSQRLASGRGVLLIHYWAPWEHDSRAQAAGLDSLRRLPELEGLQAVVVCFDPFPSVARFVARQRLRLSVLSDGRGELRRVLPCPSVPYTYVLDGAGRVAVAQAGEVDWWAPGTRATLTALLAEPVREPPPARPTL